MRLMCCVGDVWQRRCEMTFWLVTIGFFGNLILASMWVHKKYWGLAVFNSGIAALMLVDLASVL